MAALVVAFGAFASATGRSTRDGAVGVAGLASVVLADLMVGRMWPRYSVFLFSDQRLSLRLETRMAALAVAAAAALAYAATDPARR